MLLCPDCQDDWTKTAPFNTHWRTPRLPAAGQELNPVTQPIVFTITATGVLGLSQSQTFRRDGWKHYYVMWIKGIVGGTTITADPQIVAGQQGDRLTLIGTATAAAVKFVNGAGVELMTSEFILGSGDILNLVYDSVTGWVETSRDKVDLAAVVLSGGDWDDANVGWDDANISWDQS
jgi:hypothetical protein